MVRAANPWSACAGRAAHCDILDANFSVVFLGLELQFHVQQTNEGVGEFLRLTNNKR